MNDFNDFTNAQKSLGDSEFRALEALTSYQLSTEFKNHYLVFNGGTPEHCLYISEGAPMVVQELFPITYGDQGNTVESHFRELVLKEKIIPKSFLPFGRDPGGDFYCLDMSNGKIIVFRGEYLPDVESCIREVAFSMNEFISGLVQDS